MRFPTGCFSLGAALITLLVGLASAAIAQQGTISGTVTDQTTGQPVIGARVGVVGTTRAPITGWPVVWSVTVPLMVPCCAIAALASPTSSVINAAPKLKHPVGNRIVPVPHVVCKCHTT